MNEIKIQDFPLEISIWMIKKIHNSDLEADTDDEIEDVWTIVDNHNFFIGARSQKLQETACDCVERLLVECIQQPLSWKPRRPKYISFPNITDRVDIDVSKLGISCTSNVSRTASLTGEDRAIVNEPVTSCSTCDRSGSRQLFTACPECKTAMYCTSTCLKKDYDGLYEGMPGHSFWCPHMKQYTEQTEELSKFPFSFAKGTTAGDFDERRYKLFQQRLGVFGKGLWRREWSLYLSPFGGFYGELCDAADNDYVLGDLNSTFLVDPPPSPPVFSLLSWNDYVKWRCLDTDSPVAILMQWPLTLYHVIMNLFPKHYPKFDSLASKKRLTVHMIGVEKELDVLPVFYELGNLMPEVEFHVVMMGNEIAPKLHNKLINYVSCHNDSRMTFAVFLGYRHDYTGPPADIAICFNAGIAAYPSWESTLRILLDNKTPTFFTDYFHISCECARQRIYSLNADTSNVEINPFRAPVRRYIEEHNMPSFSNGFVFSLTLSS